MKYCRQAEPDSSTKLMQLTSSLMQLPQRGPDGSMTRITFPTEPRFRRPWRTTSLGWDSPDRDVPRQTTGKTHSDGTPQSAPSHAISREIWLGRCSERSVGQDINLRPCSSGAQEYASAQELDFLDLERDDSLLSSETVVRRIGFLRWEPSSFEVRPSGTKLHRVEFRQTSTRGSEQRELRGGKTQSLVGGLAPARTNT